MNTCDASSSSMGLSYALRANARTLSATVASRLALYAQSGTGLSSRQAQGSHDANTIPATCLIEAM